jgi:hypothetical protein
MMIDRPHESLPVSAIRLERDEFGAATAAVDDDVLMLVEDGAADARSLRIRLASIDVIRVSGDALELTFGDGARMAIVSPQRDVLAAQLLGRMRALPELTRTLRAFGSRRRGSDARPTYAAEQRRFFAPLLEARRRALGADAEDVIAAFDAATLAKAFSRILEQFAAERYAAAGPARRALSAELEDAAEPLFAALESLSGIAAAASRSVDDLRAWRAWTAELRAAYEAADRVWVALGPALDAPVWPE